MKFGRMSHRYGTLIDRDWKFLKLIKGFNYITCSQSVFKVGIWISYLVAEHSFHFFCRDLYTLLHRGFFLFYKL